MNTPQSARTGKRQQLKRRGEPTIPPERRIKKLEHLQSHLQTAIEVEHSTIPPYLCALYSIKDGSNPEAAQIVKSVVLEEMLHMILAANVLNAIGGSPRLNNAEFIPKYPTFLPHSDDAFRVNLEKFSKHAIETFLRIERPAKSSALPEAYRYHSLAQFYAAIELGLCELSAGGIFTGDASRQVTPEHYSRGGGEVTPVTDLPSALLALEEITGQGEGVDHTIWDGDHEKFGEVKEPAHYFRFDEIYRQRRYTAGDTLTSGPSGKQLMVQWDQVYPMRPNPKMANYSHDSALWRKAHAFNRSYTALLDELHTALNGNPQRLMRSVVGMYDLKHQAVELMKLPVGDEEMTAGPSFEYVSKSADSV
jgi:hypothetical protein